MLLPLPAVRAALRLDTPAKRFTWAAEQLYGSLFPSPAVIADPTLGIPAKPATKGLLATSVIAQIAAGNMNAGTLASNPTFFQARLYLPLDMVQVSRGVPLLLCVGQLTTDVYQPHVGAIVPGEPIPDNSAMKTFEQYLVEQLGIMLTAAPNAPAEFSSITPETTNWYNTDYLSNAVPSLIVKAALTRTGRVGNNRYGDITGIYAP